MWGYCKTAMGKTATVLTAAAMGLGIYALHQNGYLRIFWAKMQEDAIGSRAYKKVDVFKKIAQSRKIPMWIKVSSFTTQQKSKAVLRV